MATQSSWNIEICPKTSDIGKDGNCWEYFEMLPLKLMNKFTIHYSGKWVFFSKLISETESIIHIVILQDKT